MELEKHEERPTFAKTRDPRFLRKPDSDPHPEVTETHDWRIDQAATLATAEAAGSSNESEQPLPEEA